MKTMAKVLGESGRYTTNQSVKNFRMEVLALYAGGCLVCLAYGVWIGAVWMSKRVSPLTCIGVSLGFGLLVWAGTRFVNRKAKEFESGRISFRKGAVGEAVIARILTDFPEGYVVINDLSTPFGNLDHVVVGPTGVFVVETKNFKGVVSSDGGGNLLVNGKSPEKPITKALVARVMDVRKKVEVLCGSEASLTELPFFHGVLAFPSARVEAHWGSTGSVDCVTDETLWGFIVESKWGKTLNQRQVNSIAQAFLALATMDREFHNDLSAPAKEQQA
jgi:hypothetical protein